MNKRYLHRSKHYLLLLLGDFLLLLGSFVAIYALRRGHLWIEPEFQQLVPWMAGMWLLFTLLSAKFMRRDDASEFVDRIKPFLQVGVALTGAVSLLLYVLGWYHVSRFITYGTIGLFLGLELLFLTAAHYLRRRRRGETKIPVTGVLFLLDILWLLASLVMVYRYHRETMLVGEDFPLLLLGLALAWMVSALMTHSFSLRRRGGVLAALAPFWMGQAMMLGITVFIFYVTGQSRFSRTIVLGTILVFALLENLGVLVLKILRRGLPADDTAAGVTETPAGSELISESGIADSGGAPYRIPMSGRDTIYLSGQLRGVYLAGRPELMGFLDDTLDLAGIDVTRAAVLESAGAGPLERLPEGQLEFIMNLHRINDFRRINHAFIQAHRALKSGGILVVNFESLIQRREKKLRRFPIPLARLLILWDFMYRRVMPKFPGFKRVYFALSGGRNRVLSFTECLGRLFFCGFDVISWKDLDDHIFLIMRKAREPRSHKTPSYGPVFRQRRIGKNGKIVHIYKFRTMHPYAEYLQAYVHKHHQLEAGGKIDRDFRVTSWGRVMRRWLLDELPMVWNWLRRDLKLVGVRPLTEAFFATYPEDLKSLRIQVKPGLVPPYYADMPRGIEEVWASERRYLERYLKHPGRTDAAYFFKALYNIFFHHARSA